MESVETVLVEILGGVRDWTKDRAEIQRLALVVDQLQRDQERAVRARNAQIVENARTDQRLSTIEGARERVCEHTHAIGEIHRSIWRLWIAWCVGAVLAVAARWWP